MKKLLLVLGILCSMFCFADEIKVFRVAVNKLSEASFLKDCAHKLFYAIVDKWQPGILQQQNKKELPSTHAREGSSNGHVQESKEQPWMDANEGYHCPHGWPLKDSYKNTIEVPSQGYNSLLNSFNRKNALRYHTENILQLNRSIGH